ncbi:DUF7126 family protein [Halocatena pleomorpha]|uniref:CTP synthetase n=1 Tax=Halocatena pleomorpha TaxID=1785090 RepID=A0A3P3RJM3_9EURY|nr:CTP synthetase [Halocatena pleomorpha]RRJ33736.1 CTP synthetase [Halocatena pleomorpha]
MNAVVIGPDDDGLGDALEAAGVDTTRAAGTAAREQLLDAGTETAELLIVTDATLATSIPVANEINPQLRVVVYSHDSLPEFARTGAELILDPKLMAPETVAEELTA